MKLTKNIAQDAKELFKAGHKELFVNGKGEFFTSENLAKLSDKDARKITLEEVLQFLSSDKKASTKDADLEKEKAKGAKIFKTLEGKTLVEAEEILGDLKRSELDSLDSFFDSDIKDQPNMDAARQVILDELKEKEDGES